jgi:hypothetical protein
LTWLKTFFGWCTHHDEIFVYKKNLAENIFSLMELMKQQYHDIIFMPVKRFYDLIKWKTNLEEERAKIMKDQETKINQNKKRK